jgi:hypothetical protein
MLLMLAAPRAEACPRGVVCVASETRAAPAVTVAEIATGDAGGTILAEAPRGKTTIDLALRGDPATFDMLDRSLRTHVAPRAGVLEMPWIWQVLRHNVYARLPRYERTDLPKDQRFSFVLSPVVVASQQDTVPGVGVQGGF